MSALHDCSTPARQGEDAVTPHQLLNFEQPAFSPRRPRVPLLAEHIAGVREVLEANPGVSLRKLAPLVAVRLGLAHVTDHALHNFLARHRISRLVPQHVADRSARLAAKGPVLVAAPMVVLPSDREASHER